MNHHRFSPCRWLGAIALLAGLSLGLRAETNPTDFPTSLLPPPTGSYDCAGMLAFPNGVVIDSLSFRLPSTSQAPPAGGSSSTVSFSVTTRCRVSNDGGNTFSNLSTQADATLQFSSTAGATGYDTEMLQLNLSLGGGTSGGLMLRESPTLHSTGQTTVKPRADGSNRISSFFDIFTELSTDGGQTWIPANGACRSNLAAPSAENSFPTNQLPPSASTHWSNSPITFANGCVIRKLTLLNPTQPQSPPTPGGNQMVTSPLTVAGECSTDGGKSYQPFSVSTSATFRVASQLDSGGTRSFDTEMLSLDLSSLPGGVMVRESPTKQSLGRTSLRGGADNQFHISSFFDIFTELSVDGGQTWNPATSGACTCAFLRESPSKFFTNDSFPSAAHYVCDADESVSFGATGIVLRDYRRTPNAPRGPLPGPGAQQTVPMGGSTEFDLSRDGGVTFQHYYLGYTMEDVMVSGYTINGGGGEDLPTESLSLDLTTPGPSPVMIRESPSKQSLGRHTVSPTSGGFRISSFFDVFTEISLDGGQSWTPASDALHTYLLPFVEQDNVFSTNFMPPRDGSFEMRANDSPPSFSSSVRIRNIQMRDFQDCQAPPTLGDGTRSQMLHATFACELSTDGGSTWNPASTSASGITTIALRVTSEDSSVQQSYDTEMLSLNLSGGTLPNGVMIRESPSKQSLGRTTIPSPQYTPVIDSFFDVFLELSTDGGQTWLPASSAAHLELHRPPVACFTRTDWLPLDLDLSAPDHHFTTRYPLPAGVGHLVREIEFARIKHPQLVANGAVPPPAPGTSTTCTATIPVSFDYSPDDGASFSQVQCDAAAVIQYSGMTTSTDGSERDMTCEMLSLSLSGGNLPGGVMIRESPTKQSLGKTTLRAADGGYRISSFFDIFTELSTDGGQSWTPACNTLHVECRESPTIRFTRENAIPRGGRFVCPPGGLPLYCSTGKHFDSAELTCSLSGSVAPLAVGQTTTLYGDGTADVVYSLDNGQTQATARAPAFFRYEMKNVMVDSIQWSCDTEMLQLEISGGTLPSGMMIRESPTKQSLGKHTLRAAGDGTYRISSFFDVFTEISFDGGQTWNPCDRPMHYQSEDTLPSSAVASDAWPPPGQIQCSPGDPDFDTAFTNGAVLGFFDVFTESVAEHTQPPTQGGAATNSCQASCRVQVHLPGSPPLDCLANAAMTTQLTQSRPPAADGTRFFDTEMLSLDISGGTLPSGVMLRESPSKQSLGKHTIQMTSGGAMGTMTAENLIGGGGGGAGGFLVSSFFDVFLELSTDGGQSWQPASSPVHLAFAAPQIRIEQPPGTTLVNGGSTVAFPPVLTGGSVTQSFIIRNTGSMDLTVSSVSIDGTDADSFSFASPPTSPVSADGPGSAFAVSCSSATPGAKSATLHISCDDPAAGTFSITLTGRVLAPHADDDGDGIDNATELAMASSGFDPLVDSSQVLSALRDNGFYRAADMHALALGQPLFAKDPLTGHFHLSLGVLRSPNLGNWQPLTGFSISPPDTGGRFDLDITPDSSNAQFYRLFGSPPAQ